MGSFNLKLKKYVFLLFFVLCSVYGDEKIDISYEDSYSQGDNGIIPLVPLERVPDSALIRRDIARSWLLEKPEEIATNHLQIEADSAGNLFKVRPVYLKEKNLLAVVISPIDTEFSNLEKVPQGTWILYRNYETGALECIKIYPRENPELYLSIRPAQVKGRSLISICLFNAYVRKDISVGIPFENLYYLSLLELRSITKEMLPWDIFNPPIFYNGVEAASDTIRDRLKTLVFIEDGGFDEFGKPVHLTDGRAQTEDDIVKAIRPDQRLKDVKGGVNCSGFAKWIVDGMIRPIAGQGIFIKSLRTKTDVPDTYFTKPYKDKDLHFGLEWIRNLAAAALSLNVKRTIKPIVSGVDVMIEPFALVPPIRQKNMKQDFASFKGYEKTAGYQTPYLQALLYYLAISEPGHFYLGAVSREKGNPPLRQYHHIAAFFPYFDVFGNFHIDVYESGKETSIEEFMSLNSDAFTALVRIRAPQPGVFNP
nr:MULTISPECIES: hypothetical protein [unclassified Treponema]